VSHSSGPKGPEGVKQSFFQENNMVLAPSPLDMDGQMSIGVPTATAPTIPPHVGMSLRSSPTPPSAAIVIAMHSIEVIEGGGHGRS
ncbi:unnamed protein product, partial [Allacma fusca]